MANEYSFIAGLLKEQLPLRLLVEEQRTKRLSRNLSELELCQAERDVSIQSYSILMLQPELTVFMRVFKSWECARTVCHTHANFSPKQTAGICGVKC